MIISCPECSEQIQVSKEDPDASLSELYDHLHQHTWDPDEHTALFVKAQENAR